MLKIRRSHDRLIFNVGIPYLKKYGFYIETGSRLSLIQLCAFSITVDTQPTKSPRKVLAAVVMNLTVRFLLTGHCKNPLYINQVNTFRRACPALLMPEKDSDYADWNYVYLRVKENRLSCIIPQHISHVLFFPNLFYKCNGDNRSCTDSKVWCRQVH